MLLYPLAYVLDGHVVHTVPFTYVPGLHAHVPAETNAVEFPVHVYPVCVELTVPSAGGFKQDDTFIVAEYCPLGHCVHTSTFIYDPAGHEAATHVEPLRRYPCDTLHVNPVYVALTVEFAGGLEHDVAPAAEYVPAEHVVHDVALAAVEYVPAEHGVHDDAPAAEYVPAEHGVHDVAPAVEYVPAAHTRHVELFAAPVFVEYVPAGQSRHVPE